MRFVGVCLLLAWVAGCKHDATPEESAASAEPAGSAAPSTTAEAAAEEAAAGVGETARTLERTRVSRSRETVRSDAPKTKAVVGN